MDAEEYAEYVRAKWKAIRALADICSEGQAPVEVVTQAAIALLQFRPQTIRVFRHKSTFLTTQPTSENRETAGDRSLC